MSDRLLEIKARCEAATIGPWTDWDKNPIDESWAAHYPADRDFIAHAREDMDWLIEKIERLAEHKPTCQWERNNYYESHDRPYNTACGHHAVTMQGDFCQFCGGRIIEP